MDGRLTKDSGFMMGTLEWEKLFQTQAAVLLSSPSEAAPYLPQEDKSPLFSVQREGLPEDGTLYRINR